MRKLLDNDSSELTSILEQLIREDCEVTVREVARRHTTLKNASAFTRNPVRMALIGAAQQRQKDARCVRVQPIARKEPTLAMTLEHRSEEVQELRRQVQALVASHAGCIKAVLSHGGMGSLERYWRDYKSVGAVVKALATSAPAAAVIQLFPQDAATSAAPGDGSN